MPKTRVGPVQPTRGDAAAKFLFEWIFVASFPVSIPFLIVFALRKAFQHSAMATPLPTVALTGYAIAVTYAFLYDLTVTDWTNSDANFRILLGHTFRYGRFVIVALSVIMITLASLIEKAPPIGQVLQSDSVFVWSIYLAATAAVFAGASVIFRPFPKRRKN